MELTVDRMYKAIVEKDTSFEGVFFTALLEQPYTNLRDFSINGTHYLNNIFH